MVSCLASPVEKGPRPDAISGGYANTCTFWPTLRSFWGPTCFICFRSSGTSLVKKLALCLPLCNFGFDPHLSARRFVGHERRQQKIAFSGSKHILRHSIGAARFRIKLCVWWKRVLGWFDTICKLCPKREFVQFRRTDRASGMNDSFNPLTLGSKEPLHLSTTKKKVSLRWVLSHCGLVHDPWY